MRRESRWQHTLAVAGALITLVLGPTPAHAQYLDPGAGSIIVQAVFAFVVGLAVTLKLYWGRISAFLKGRSKRDPER
jgi:hypothetical protein